MQKLSKKDTFLTLTQRGIYWKALLFMVFLLAFVLVLPSVTAQATGMERSILTPLNIILCTVIFLWLLAQARVLSILTCWRFDKRQVTGIAILAVPIGVALVFVGITPDKSGSVVIPLAKMQLVAAFQELLLRGVLLLAFVHAYMHQEMDNPVFRAVFLLAGVFGAMQMVTLTNTPLGGVVVQVVQTVMMGFAMFAFVLIVRNIWLGIMLQGLNSVTHVGQILPTGLDDTVNTAIVTTMMALAYWSIMDSEDEDSLVRDLKRA